jgi:hypothetical protein
MPPDGLVSITHSIQRSSVRAFGLIKWCIEGVHPHPRRAIEWGKDGNDNSAQVAEGRKPAQPSIPEGILGFPPP